MKNTINGEPELKLVWLTILLINISHVYAQTSILNLDKVRKQYCIKNCAAYKTEIIKAKNVRKSPPPSENKSKVLKMFAIPGQKRLQLFPFSSYDSIYISIPNMIENVGEPRNYLDEKYQGYKELVTKSQKESLSNILFNYYKLNDVYHTSVKNEIGCKCLEAEYPKILLLFYKNSKPLYFLALPNDGYTRTNFKNDKLKAFDLNDEKEELILKFFDDFIKKRGNKPCDTIHQIKEPVLIEKKHK